MTRGLGPRWGFALASAGALVVTLAAYSNSLPNAFHFDDSHVVQGNLYIRSLKNLPQFFTDATTGTSHPPNATYRPLVTTSLAMDYWVADGLDVRQFHRSQIAMLIVLGAFLYSMYAGLLRRVDDRPVARYAALAAATWFCVHTANTEAMNIISARSELLSALGLVGSFLAYLHLPWSRRAHLYLIPMAIGALAKSPAVMFGPLFCAYLFLFEEQSSMSDLLTRRGWESVRRALWKGFPALLLGAALFFFAEAMNGPVVNYAGGGRWEYLRTELWVWLHYGRLLFLPVGLTADTDWSLIPKWYDTRVIAGLLFVALLMMVLWVTSKTARSRPVAFGIAWFIIGLVPGSTVFPLAEVANEHRVFLPYIGATLSVVWGIVVLAERWCERRIRSRRSIMAVAAAAVLFLVGANAFGTYRRNEVWRTEETLWRDVTVKSPANGRGWMNYGLTQMAEGRYQEAKQLFERALVYSPNYGTLEINLGIVTGRLGDDVTAERHFERGLQLEPNDPSPLYFYGRWLTEKGRAEEAVPLLQRSIALSPAGVDARHQLLDAYAATGRTAELRSLAGETLAIVPDDPSAKHYLSAEGALPAGAAVASRPETAESLVNTSLRLYQAHDFEGSAAAAKQALELRPDYAEAYNNVASSMAALGRWDEAISAAREALRLKPDFQLARNNLAWAESEKRKAQAGGGKARP